MKKLLLLILGFILGALAMYYYCNSDKGDESMAEIPTPSGLIKPAEIKALTEAYNPRYEAINDSLFRGVQGGDNRSSWYDIEDLENFIALAKIQAKDLKYTLNGIRIYPGAHPPVGAKPGYTTYLLVPTGIPNNSEGSMLFLQGGKGDDINGGNGLNKGDDGDPPGSNYPQ